MSSCGTFCVMCLKPPPCRSQVFLHGAFLLGSHWGFPFCFSSTVIHGLVLESQVTHLLDKECSCHYPWFDALALHHVWVVYVPIITSDAWDPLQSLFWSLEDPAHAIATETKSKSRGGEHQGHKATQSLPQNPKAVPHTGYLQTERHPAKKNVP